MKVVVTLELKDDNDKVLGKEVGVLAKTSDISTTNIIYSLKQWCAECYCRLLVGTVGK